MIAATETDCPRLRVRFRPLAGPFYARDAASATALMEHLTASKARVIVAHERGGVTIFRLRSECETIAQTASRRRKLSIR